MGRKRKSPPIPKAVVGHRLRFRGMNRTGPGWSPHPPFSQPRPLFELFDAGQRARLFANLAAAMQGAPAHVVERQLKLFDQVHPLYGAGVSSALARQGEVCAVGRALHSRIS